MIPKPEPRKKAKARRKRAEAALEQAVREVCAERDGHCRLVGQLFVCVGRSELAHLEGKRRWETRGMAPEDRHSPAWEVMMCTKHHQDYDAHKFSLDWRHNAEGAAAPIGLIVGGERVGEI